MRVDHSHDSGEAVIGNAEDTHLAVGLRKIFYEPVYGVVGVGSVIHRGGIEWASKRAGHNVVALGAVFSAYILHNTDVATFDDHIIGIVITLEDRTQVRAFRMAGKVLRVIRSTRQ